MNILMPFIHKRKTAFYPQREGFSRGDGFSYFPVITPAFFRRWPEGLCYRLAQGDFEG
jgi:hypothetical protein